MAEPYIWKGASTFVSNDGSVLLGMKVYQNDGKGVPLVMTSYTAPYNYKWDNYEATPLNRTGGIYGVGGKNVTWPKSQSGLAIVSNGSDSCANGYIGYTESGGAQREFGDRKCEAKMDAQTSRR